MLLAKFEGSYRKPTQNGKVPTVVFRYTVSGTPEEMDAYKKVQGDNFRSDENTGKPLYFTTRYISDRVKLLITTGDNPRVVADDSEIVKIQSIVQSYGADVARLILGNVGTPAPAGE